MVQTITGIVIVVGTIAWRLRSSRPTVVCLATTAAVAIAFYVAYAADPIAFLAG